jgi:glycosyltransferase involved in cell wall biosynthesis
MQTLLITTQTVDSSDANLGFFVRWIEEFAKHASRVTVICLEEGEHHLPENVSVLSLGKEKLEIRNCLPAHGAQAGKLEILRRAAYIFRFLRYIWSERRNYDAVFAHMNPEYVLLGGIFWRFLGKKIGFWYTHKSKRLLRLALPLLHRVFTPSRGSFPISSRKVRIVGHVIDTELFSPKTGREPRHHPPVILSDTRITPSKHVERTLEISKELKKRGVEHVVRVIGAAITKEDMGYEKRLRERVRGENLPILFIGGVPFERVPDYYGQADLFINHSNVGALNKTALQAMSMNIPVLTSNESYRGILPDEDIVPADPVLFAQRIQTRLSKPSLVSYRERVEREHSLEKLIPKILHYYA